MGEWIYRSHIFLTSALVGGEWSASRPCRFTHWLGGWVKPRASRDDLVKRQFLILPRLELRPLGCPASNQSLYTIRYPMRPRLDWNASPLGSLSPCSPHHPTSLGLCTQVDASIPMIIHRIHNFQTHDTCDASVSGFCTTVYSLSFLSKRSILALRWVSTCATTHAMWHMRWLHA
jgi:hypothetical protein